MHRHRAAPAWLGQRDLAARPGPPPAGHRGGVHRWPRSAWPTCRRSPPTLARAGSRTARPPTGAWVAAVLIVLLGAGRRGRAPGRGRRFLRPRRPAAGGSRDGPGGVGGKERDRAGRAAHPADHDRAARPPGRGSGHRPAPAPGSGRSARGRSASRTRPVTAMRSCSASLSPTPRRCTRRRARRVTLADVLSGVGLGRRCLILAWPGPLPAPAAGCCAAAPEPGPAPGGPDPAVPERSRQRLRHLDRHRPDRSGRGPRVHDPLT